MLLWAESRLLILVLLPVRVSFFFFFCEPATTSSPPSSKKECPPQVLLLSVYYFYHSYWSYWYFYDTVGGCDSIWSWCCCGCYYYYYYYYYCSRSVDWSAECSSCLIRHPSSLFLLLARFRGIKRGELAIWFSQSTGHFTLPAFELVQCSRIWIGVISYNNAEDNQMIDNNARKTSLKKRFASQTWHNELERNGTTWHNKLDLDLGKLDLAQQVGQKQTENDGDSR